MLAASVVLAAAQQWTLQLVQDPSGRARCLDGSPPGYYVRKGYGSGSSKWMIHLQGGGWCASHLDCLARALGYNSNGMPSLGGSAAWPRTATCPDASAPPCVLDGGDNGALSLNASVNPDWYNANAVFVGYCDGGSFSGHVDAPVDLGNGTQLYLRGRLVLDAILADLQPRMGGATDVVVKGCSAGGLATFIHAERLDAFARAISGVERVAVLPGAGAFLDVKSFPGPRAARLYFLEWSLLHNVSGSLPPECLAHPPEPGLAALCVFPQYILPHIDPSVALFVSNSLADWSQQSWVMDLGCDPLNASDPCSPAQIAYLNRFRGEMLDALAPLVGPSSNRTAPSGAFLAECSLHIIVDNDGAWSGVTVQGQSQTETFSAWFNSSASVNRLSSPLQRRFIVIDGEWGSNPTCSLYVSPSWLINVTASSSS